MAKKICPICGKKIGLLKKITARNCSACNSYCHRGCTRICLDYDAFIKNEIVEKILCKNCATENSSCFGNKSICEQCGEDFSVSKTLLFKNWAQCERCGHIGHSSCYSKNVKSINPYLYYLYP